jgi:hypothetical protein
LSSTIVALSVFACIFGAALLGMLIRAAIPEQHLSSEAQDTVKLAMGLVATMVALILGLLISSAKATYDAEKLGVTQMAAKIVNLDRLLANYGPDAKEPRGMLRTAVQRAINRMWPDKASEPAQLDPSASRAEGVYIAIQQLSPHNDLQTTLKSHALATALELGQLRWLEFEESGNTISLPILLILTSWLAILFVSFGLFAPSNGTVVVALFLSALSVAGAVYLLMELDCPFDGMIQISSEPFVSALAHLGE